MIVFSENEYSFINYKDKVPTNFTTVISVSKITKQLVATPQVGANSVVIYANGKIVTNGSPMPGGVIYLQNDYVAIDYNSNTSFEIIISDSYKYKTCYSALWFTRHQSTPVCRALNVNPESLTFTADGSLVICPDAIFNCADSDYVCLENGEVIAEFGVKERTYFGLPMPYYFSVKNALAYIRHLKTSTYPYLARAKAVSGLRKDASISAMVSTCRDQMHKLQTLALDLSVAKEFMLPISDGALTSSRIASALGYEAWKSYLDNSQTVEEPIDHTVQRIILDSNAFDDILIQGISSDSLIEYLKSDELSRNILVLLNTDFEKLLQMYAQIYDYCKLQLAKGACSSLKAGLRTLLMNAKTLMSSLVPVKLKEKFRDEAWSNTRFHFIGDFDVRSDKLTFLDKLDLSDQTPLTGQQLLQYCIDTIIKYGADSELTNEDFAEIKRKAEEGSFETDEQMRQAFEKIDFLNPSAMFKGGNARQAVDSLSETVAETIHKMVSRLVTANQISASVTTDINRHGCPSVDLLLFSIDWTHTIELVRGTVVNVEDVYIDRHHCQIDFTITLKEFDAVLRNNIQRCSDRAWANVEESLRQTYFQAGMELTALSGWCDSGNSVSYAVGCKSTWHPSRNGWGHKNSTTKRFRLNCEVSNAFDVYLGYIGSEDGTDQSKYVSSLFEDAIQFTAAQNAFNRCKSLFESVKVNYETKAIGMLGDSYSGVVVSLGDMKYVAPLDQAYLKTLLALINGISDNYSRKNLQAFISQVNDLTGEFKNSAAVHYNKRESVMTAEGSTSVDAFIHYVYGGLA